MNRRQALRASVSGLVGAVATSKVVAQSGGIGNLAPGEQFESIVRNATSGLYILKNNENDFSVKIVSGDGAKNVTIVRYVGSTAEADAQLVHTLFRSMLLALRLDV